jgi:hypothetical protein
VAESSVALLSSPPASIREPWMHCTLSICGRKHFCRRVHRAGNAAG